MTRLDFPIGLIQLASMSFTNCTPMIMVNEFTSHIRVFKKDLPQGSVVSQIIATIYMNSFLDKSYDFTLMSIYADDLIIAKEVRNKNQANQKLQKKLDKIADRSVEAKLILNTSNAKQCSIALTVYNRSCNPSLIYLGERCPALPIQH